LFPCQNETLKISYVGTSAGREHLSVNKTPMMVTFICSVDCGFVWKLLTRHVTECKNERIRTSAT